MKIYIACFGMMAETYPDYLLPRLCQPEPKLCELRSYFELRSFTGHTIPRFGNPFFLDSGAFSAYSQGVPVTLEEYGNFLLKHKDQIDHYCNLDEIPRAQTQEEVLRAAEVTLQNQKYLESLGLNPVPVFHKNEPWEYLEMYIEKYDYICLGGLYGDIDQHLSKCWSKYLLNQDGTAKRKIHGFGMTTLRHLFEYPWYSVDSSTWLVHSKYGIIAYPSQNFDGSFNYRTKPILLPVSDQSSYVKEAGRHYKTLLPLAQKAVDQYLQGELGMSIEEVSNEPPPRFVANIKYWLRVEQALRNTPCEDRRPKAIQQEILL